ncbi:unnamed protein product [Adineta steineri]|uniref:Uncharacterized protein n=1 Tax=Adineta steineri TaxID=433720 RepID=A0A814K3M7_9BILA|nr:unnamed protein product [Adineta steineri]CAF3562017.1 unnamed protein product [Adineta steineri]
MKPNNFKPLVEKIRKRKSHNQKIHDAHVLRTQEKESAKQTQDEHRQAVKTAMDQYKTNKQNRLKKLVKKTRRGQPVMKGQIDLLLDKIQKEKEKEKQ